MKTYNLILTLLSVSISCTPSLQEQTTSTTPSEAVKVFSSAGWQIEKKSSSETVDLSWNFLPHADQLDNSLSRRPVTPITLEISAANLQQKSLVQAIEDSIKNPELNGHLVTDEQRLEAQKVLTKSLHVKDLAGMNQYDGSSARESFRNKWSSEEGRSLIVDGSFGVNASSIKAFELFSAVSSFYHVSHLLAGDGVQVSYQASQAAETNISDRFVWTIRVFAFPINFVPGEYLFQFTAEARAEGVKLADADSTSGSMTLSAQLGGINLDPHAMVVEPINFFIPDSNSLDLVNILLGGDSAELPSIGKAKFDFHDSPASYVWQDLYSGISEQLSVWYYSVANTEVPEVSIRVTSESGHSEVLATGKNQLKFVLTENYDRSVPNDYVVFDGGFNRPIIMPQDHFATWLTPEGDTLIASSVDFNRSTDNENFDQCKPSHITLGAGNESRERLRNESINIFSVGTYRIAEAPGGKFIGLPRGMAADATLQLQELDEAMQFQVVQFNDRPQCQVLN